LKWNGCVTTWDWTSVDLPKHPNNIPNDYNYGKWSRHTLLTTAVAPLQQHRTERRLQSYEWNKLHKYRETRRQAHQNPKRLFNDTLLRVFLDLDTHTWNTVSSHNPFIPLECWQTNYWSHSCRLGGSLYFRLTSNLACLFSWINFMI